MGKVFFKFVGWSLVTIAVLYLLNMLFLIIPNLLVYPGEAFRKILSHIFSYRVVVILLLYISGIYFLKVPKRKWNKLDSWAVILCFISLVLFVLLILWVILLGGNL